MHHRVFAVVTRQHAKRIDGSGMVSLSRIFEQGPGETRIGRSAAPVDQHLGGGDHTFDHALAGGS